MSPGVFVTQNISEALEAAKVVVNEWLGAAHPLIALHLESEASIRRSAGAFVRGARRRKVGWWNWEDLYWRKVRYKKAWLFSLRRGEQPVAMCLGTISIKADHVALEYLERRPYVHGVRGVPLNAAFRFALAVAGALGLSQVRINNPINAKLARFYARALDMTPVRQKPGGDVDYLFKNVNEP